MNGLYTTHNTGLSNGLLHGLSGPDASSGSGYCLEARMLFIAMTVQPDPIRKKLINDFIVGCKLDGNWYLIDLMYFLAAHSTQAAKLNWKNPESFFCNEFNSPTWVTDIGFNGNGVNSYLSTTWIPSINGGSASLNNASLGAYFRVDAAIGSERDFGTAGLSLNPRNGSNVFAGAVNSGDTTLASGSVNSKGLISVGRLNSTTTTGERNGVQLGSAAVPSTSIPAQPIYIGAANNGVNVASSFSSRQMSFVYFGSGNVNRLLLYNRVQTYLTALGAAV